ncbi:MAG: hypothetical protein R3C44_12455 [Chloroflexota bacterium]
MELESTHLESTREALDIEPHPWQGFGFFSTLIALALPLLAVGVFILPFLDHSMLRRLARLPGLGNIVDWLVNSNGSWLAGLSLLLLWIIFLVFRRWQIMSNEHQWVDAGCPQCLEHELVRVSRQRSDRWYGLLGIPAYRYACRNCTWRGLRVARRHRQIVLSQEELIVASSLALEPAGGSNATPVASAIQDDWVSDPVEPIGNSTESDEVIVDAIVLEDEPATPPVDETDEIIDEIVTEDHLQEDRSEPLVAPANNHSDPLPDDDDLDWLWQRLSDNPDNT